MEIDTDNADQIDQMLEYAVNAEPQEIQSRSLTPSQETSEVLNERDLEEFYALPNDKSAYLLLDETNCTDLNDTERMSQERMMRNPFLTNRDKFLKLKVSLEAENRPVREIYWHTPTQGYLIKDLPDNHHPVIGTVVYFPKLDVAAAILPREDSALTHCARVKRLSPSAMQGCLQKGRLNYICEDSDIRSDTHVSYDTKIRQEACESFFSNAPSEISDTDLSQHLREVQVGFSEARSQVLEEWKTTQKQIEREFDPIRQVSELTERNQLLEVMEQSRSNEMKIKETQIDQMLSAIEALKSEREQAKSQEEVYLTQIKTLVKQIDDLKILQTKRIVSQVQSELAQVEPNRNPFFSHPEQKVSLPNEILSEQQNPTQLNREKLPPSDEQTKNYLAQYELFEPMGIDKPNHAPNSLRNYPQKSANKPTKARKEGPILDYNLLNQPTQPLIEIPFNSGYKNTPNMTQPQLLPEQSHWQSSEDECPERNRTSFKKNSSVSEPDSSDPLVQILQEQQKQNNAQIEATKNLALAVQSTAMAKNDLFVQDIPIFEGDPRTFRSWVMAIEKVHELTDRSEYELACAKCNDRVYRVIQNQFPIGKNKANPNWQLVKQKLSHHFSSTPTGLHASALLNEPQSANESLEDFINRYAELSFITSGGKHPTEIKDQYYIATFSGKLFNPNIRRKMTPGYGKLNRVESLEAAFQKARSNLLKYRDEEGLERINVQVNAGETDDPVHQENQYIVNQVKAKRKAEPIPPNKKNERVPIHSISTHGNRSIPESRIIDRVPRRQADCMCYACKKTGHYSIDALLCEQHVFHQQAVKDHTEGRYQPEDYKRGGKFHGGPIPMNGVDRNPRRTNPNSMIDSADIKQMINSLVKEALNTQKTHELSNTSQGNSQERGKPHQGHKSVRWEDTVSGQLSQALQQEMDETKASSPTQ